MTDLKNRLNFSKCASRDVTSSINIAILHSYFCISHRLKVLQNRKLSLIGCVNVVQIVGEVNVDVSS